jgi:hypothetical protein
VGVAETDVSSIRLLHFSSAALQMLGAAPSANPPLWLIVPVAIIFVPLLVYLWVRLRRLRSGADR